MTQCNRRCACSAFLAIASVALHGAHAADERPEVRRLAPVEVIGTTPLPGIGIPIRDVPANVQVITGGELAGQHQGSLGEHLEQNPTSVSINSSQGNPFQPDINYRGFTASPLLGTPQGISVFLDGVRINEPFGDAVNWDLVPQSALSSVQLIPGSIPAFGLNTLGGAVALYTRSGRDSPGGGIELAGGSFGRRTIEFEQGGTAGRWDWFVTGNHVEDKGWAEHNASRVGQWFGKVGYHDDRTDVAVSGTVVDNVLEGTQTLPVSFLDQPRRAYTFPDRNANRLRFVTVTGSHVLTDDLSISGNVYERRYRNGNISSNVNRNFALVDARSGAIDDTQATNDRADIDQVGRGLGLQLTYAGDVAARRNQLSLGASIDHGRADFTQASQPAQFTAARDTVGTGDYAPVTDARTTNRYTGVFVADTLNLDSRWSLTASGRYNRADIDIADRTGNAPLLNGAHRYARFNRAVGVNFNPDPAVTLYAAYNEGMRAPTPIELTCSDPEAPCKLPNNFLADPDLKAVRSRTFEGGGRGRWSNGVRWSAALYRTDLADDIQFISSGAGFTNAGYFQNVGRTRRQGIELAVDGKLNGWTWSARYGFLDATFRTGFRENSESNSSADAEGAIRVERGNRIAGLPQHNVKLRVQHAWSDAITIGANVNTTSAVYARGDEDNRDVHGRIPGFVVVHLDARYPIGRGLEAFARINNLFDRRYANFGVVGQNFFTGPARSFGPAAGVEPIAEQFRSPGTPRGAWAGLRYRWT